MSEIIDIVRVKCPDCGYKTIADKHDCGCVFANCEGCGTDFEIDKHCKNN